MKSFKGIGLLLAFMLLLGGWASGSLGDRWAVLDGSNNDLWHVDANGVLSGTSDSGGFNPNKMVTQSVSANTTLTKLSPQYTFVTNATAVIYLPDATLCPGKPINLKYHTGTAGNISVEGDGSQTIDGALLVNITTRGHLGVISDGSNWGIVDN